MDQMINNFTVPTLITLINERLEHLAHSVWPEAGLLLRVEGALGPIRSNGGNGSKLYGLALNDNGHSLMIDVPRALVSQNNLRGGERVAAMGVLKVEMGRFTDGKVQFRLDVVNIEQLDADQGGAEAPGGAGRVDVVQRLKSIAPRRNLFPNFLPVRLSMVVSKSGKALVDEDFLGELKKLPQGMVLMQRIETSMLDPAAIANAIQQSSGDVIAVLRGGGDDSQFAVFDHPAVIEALASKKNAYRIVGLGHSGNVTLLDWVADYAASTPTQAGVHIRENVEGMLTVLRSNDAPVEPCAPGNTDGVTNTTDEADQSTARMPRALWWVMGLLALCLAAYFFYW